MKSAQVNNKALAVAALSVVGTLAWYHLRSKKEQIKLNTTEKKSDTEVVLLGDVGGTNIRLMLKRLDLQTRTSSVLKDFKTYRS